MITALLLALSCGVGAQAGGWVDAQAAAAFRGGIAVEQIDSGTTFDHERYAISGRIRTSRYSDAYRGSRQEYFGALRRELYHVTVVGRLGTSPPTAQRAAYHFAGGEMRFTFYGMDLGPEHPEISAQVWESSGPAPSPSSLNRTWVTQVAGVYSNINNHIQTNASQVVVVENVWQFRVRETWRERVWAGVEVGSDRYGRVIDKPLPRVEKLDIELPGGGLSFPGWPNNWVGGSLGGRLGPVALTAAGTRLNLLGNEVEGMWGLTAEWTASPRWALRAGFLHRERKTRASRDGVTLGATLRW